MKRCPQCDFLYFDTDDLCDLDGTKLVHVNDADLPPEQTARLKPAQKRSNLLPLIATGIGGVLLGSVLVLGYLFSVRSRQQPQSQTTVERVQQASPTPVNIVANPSPETSPSPAASPTASPKAQAPGGTTKRVPMSKDPVSTSMEGASGPIWIRLSNGARIEADEVWRTKEGVWYRRNGVVTLIKANRVKAIERGR